MNLHTRYWIQTCDSSTAAKPCHVGCMVDSWDQNPGGLQSESSPVTAGVSVCGEGTLKPVLRMQGLFNNMDKAGKGYLVLKVCISGCCHTEAILLRNKCFYPLYKRVLQSL